MDIRARMSDGLLVFEAATAPDEIVDEYLRGLEAQIRRTPAFLNRTTKDILTAPGNDLIVYLRKKQLVAGLYTKSEIWGARQVRKINGLFSELHGYDIARRLIGRAVTTGSGAAIFAGSVRVLPTGDTNAGAARAFGLNGFFPTKIENYQISDNSLDTHLYASAEDDGETYRALTFIARSKDLLTNPGHEGDDA